jgi:hypothetical protein
MMKNKIALLAMIMLLSTVVSIQPVLADEVYIDVDMNGDAYVNIENTDGNLIVIYNGRDILAELEAYYKELLDLQSQLAYLQGLANLGDLQGDFTELYIQVGILIEDLEDILKDLYGNLGFLAHVIGVNPGNNSAIVEVLLSGNATIVDYLDQAFNSIYDLDGALTYTNNELVGFQDYTQQQLSDLQFELVNFEDYTQQQLNSTYNELKSFEKYIEDQLVMLDVSLLDEANRQVTLEGKLETVQNMFYGAMGFSAVLAVALIVVGRKIWIK